MLWARHHQTLYAVLVIELVIDRRLFGRELAARDFDTCGEDLREVTLTNTVGESRGRCVVAFQRRVAEDA